MEYTHKYDDILQLPHHVSSKHPQMDVQTRAAQFAPFAALTGYEDAVNETARLTQEKIQLDENKKAELDEKMTLLQELLKKEHSVLASFTYFQKDAKKEGGTYIQCEGSVKKVDIYTHRVLLEEGQEISIEDIVEIELLEHGYETELGDWQTGDFW